MWTPDTDGAAAMQELLPDVNAALNGLGPLVHHLAGKRLLVTGARGYLGRYVVAFLVEANRHLRAPCEVVALDSLVTGAADRSDWRNVPHISFVQHDVRHHIGGGLLAERFDFVLHMAGIASPYWYNKLPMETIAVAVDGSRHMLELAKRDGARYLFTSSSEVYQTASVVPTPESYVGAIPSMCDRAPYDVSKLLGETLVYVVAKDGVDAGCVRIFNSFGIGLNEADRRILPRIASAVEARKKLRIYGHHGRLPRRTYTPVANTLLGLLLALLKGERGEIYNVGLDTPELTVPELCQRVSSATGQEVRYDIVVPPDNYATEPMRRCPDITKLRSLGFRPVVDLDEGLRRFFRWASTTYSGEP